VQRPHSNWFSGIVVVIIVIATVIFFAGYPFRSGAALKISSITLTNNAALGSQAVFGVTNESPDNLNFVTAALQTKSSFGVWINVPHAAKNVSLAGHTADTFTVDLPSTHASWRLPVFWCYEQSDFIVSLRGRAEANLYFNWQNLKQGRSLHYFNSMMGNSYMVISPEITN
jgi:hypothetical protein